MSMPKINPKPSKFCSRYALEIQNLAELWTIAALDF